MKLCSFTSDALPRPRLGLVTRDGVVDVTRLAESRPGEWPRDMATALDDWSRHEPVLRALARAGTTESPRPLDGIRLLPPVPRPPTFRDFYAFEQHVRAARARRGLEMVPEWYEAPAFYFSNPLVMRGDGAPVRRPPGCEWLDFELEIGAVVGRPGRDLAAEHAEDHLAGYCILNDWSARDLQRQEMKVGLGPAKGKDFATSLGPWLVTPDELADRRTGRGYDLEMTAWRNGTRLSRGNWKDLHFSFGEMLARASRGVDLVAGEVLGSGTVGTGCILELGPEHAGGWLQPGDEIRLAIERLGSLTTLITE